MSPSSNRDITKLLAAVKDGDRQAEAELIDVVYGELRILARSQMRKERADHTLQPTALVHETYLRLMGRKSGTPHDRVHFFAAAATVMRRILVDHARKRTTVKRGAGAHPVEANDLLAAATPKIEQLLLIDGLLTRLAEFAPKEARVVELVYFGGLSLREAGAMLDPPVSERTAKRYWKDAKDWLEAEVRKKAG